jgi:hypothetical protein
MNVEKLTKDAAETLQSLENINRELTKDEFILYGAALSVLNHAKIAAPTADENKSAVAWYLESARDELDDAEKYLKRYLQTGESLAKTTGVTELQHAQQWISAAQSMQLSDKEAAELRGYLSRLQDLQRKLL